MIEKKLERQADGHALLFGHYCIGSLLVTRSLDL